MNLLALDLGTKTGYALSTEGTTFAATWILSTPAAITQNRKLRLDRRCDPRVAVLWDALTSTHSRTPLDWLFFEDVQFATTTMQCQLWSSFRTVLWLFAHTRRVKIECCPVGTLKKFATGTGAATKGQMETAMSRSGYWDPEIQNFLKTKSKLDDNGVDALHLLNWGKKLVSRL